MFTQSSFIARFSPNMSKLASKATLLISMSVLFIYSLHYYSLDVYILNFCFNFYNFINFSAWSHLPSQDWFFFLDFRYLFNSLNKQWLFGLCFKLRFCFGRGWYNAYNTAKKGQGPDLVFSDIGSGSAGSLLQWSRTEASHASEISGRGELQLFLLL